LLVFEKRTKRCTLRKSCNRSANVKVCNDDDDGGGGDNVDGGGGDGGGCDDDDDDECSHHDKATLAHALRYAALVTIDRSAVLRTAVFR